MSYLSEIKREIAEKGREESTTKGMVQALQAAYIKDNPVCKCGNTENLTYDHIIPVSILADFNIDAKRTFWEENSQTLCYACNQKKGMRLDLAIEKTKALLLSLIG